MSGARTVLAGAAAGALAGGLIAFAAVRRPAPAAADPAEAWLAKNLAEVERQVFADVDRYGVDIYRLYNDISRMMPGRPEDDFGGDKAIKKLSVTYPDSNVRMLADAFCAYGAVRRRDMLRIESYLETLERRPAGSPPQLMPNGFEIEPQLVMAQYDYFFQTGRTGDAEKALAYLEARFPDSWLSRPPSRPFSVAGFVRRQRRVLAAAKRRGGDGK